MRKITFSLILFLFSLSVESLCHIVNINITCEARTSSVPPSFMRKSFTFVWTVWRDSSRMFDIYFQSAESSVWNPTVKDSTKSDGHVWVVLIRCVYEFTNNVNEIELVSIAMGSFNLHVFSLCVTLIKSRFQNSTTIFKNKKCQWM